MVTRLEEETRIGKGGTQAARLDLKVLVELGCVPFARSGRAVAVPPHGKLHERARFIITTNLGFGKWPNRNLAGPNARGQSREARGRWPWLSNGLDFEH